LLGKIPGMGGMNIPDGAMDGMNKEMNKNVAIINSMTAQEKQFPAFIKGSPRKRIAAGSGTQVQDVNRMLKQFTQMQKMMKKMGNKGAMKKMMRGMGGGGMGGGGGMPPGFPM